MIAASQVTFAYGGTPVLEAVDLRVEEGGTLALVGPSGCGKTTLLKLLGGLLHPTGGQVSRSEGGVGFAFQDPRLLPWMTVRENVAFALECAGVPRASWGERIDPLLARVHLDAVGGARPHALSGGMAQRAGLVRALVLRPRCLFLDEPFSSVDPLLRETLQEELQDLLADASGRNRTATVLVTHDVGEAVFLGDQVLVLSHAPGRVLRRVEVPASRPRQPRFRQEPLYHDKVAEVREALAG